MKFKPEFKTELVYALRSGRYDQTYNVLRSVHGYCCLGVVCDLAKDQVGMRWGDNPEHPSAAFTTTGVYYFGYEGEAETALPLDVVRQVVSDFDQNDVWSETAGDKLKGCLEFLLTEEQQEAASAMFPGVGAPVSLGEMNDRGGVDFYDIADFIEQHC